VSIPTEAVILCGGQGTRLGLPGQKCMVQIDEELFLDKIIEQLNVIQVERIVLACGHGADQVRDEFGNIPSVVISEEPQPLGTGGALRLAAEQIKGESFLCLNGDSYVDFPLHQFVEWFDLVDPDAGVLLVPEQGTQTKHLGLAHEHGGKWVNGGVYAFKRHLFDDWGRWPAGPVKLGLEEDLFPLWRSAGKKLIGYQSNARWIDIGTPESLARVGEFFKQLGATTCASS